jgi:hypothetical protein
MSERKKISILNIVLDAGTQMRETINDEAIADYQRSLDSLPPISVWEIGSGHFAIVDGFHRYYAHQRSGAESIDAIVVGSGTIVQAQWLACGVNAEHGIRRTNSDKRLQILAALRIEPGASNRHIAAHCRVDHKTVAAVRAASGEIPTEPIGTVAEFAIEAIDPFEFLDDDGGESVDAHTDERGPDDRPSEQSEVPTVAQRQEAAKARLVALLKAFDRWKAEVELAMGEESGRWIHEQSFANYARDLRLCIDRAKPSGVCPQCKGGGCPSCMGIGWISRGKSQVLRQMGHE